MGSARAEELACDQDEVCISVVLPAGIIYHQVDSYRTTGTSYLFTRHLSSRWREEVRPLTCSGLPPWPNSASSGLSMRARSLRCTWV